MKNLNWLGHTNICIDGFSDILKSVCENKMPAEHSKISTKGYKSQQFTLRYNFKDITEITSKVITELKKFDVLQNKELTPLMAWTVYGEHGGYHKVHNHVGEEGKLNHITAILYLNTPEKIGVEMKGEFYYFLLDKDKIKYHELQPEKGMMIVTPTSTFHGAYPQPEGLRHTLNFDFGVTDK